MSDSNVSVFGLRKVFLYFVFAAFLIAILAATGALARTPNPIPKGSDNYYFGNILTGSKFGVRVGDSRIGARIALEKHEIGYVGEVGCDYNLAKLIECDQSKKIDLYSSRSFTRRGNVYIEYIDGHVVGIVWDLYLLPYVDF